MRRTILIAALSLVAAACSTTVPASTRAEQPTFDVDATRRIIASQNERFAKAHVTGDIGLIDAMFTADAKAFPPGGPAVTGAAALHAFTADYIAAGVSEFREESTDFYGNAEYVVDAGTYVVTYGPAHTTERGKYLNVWTPVNGSWKIKSNMWNSAAPVP